MIICTTPTKHLGAIKMEVKELTEEAEKGSSDCGKDKPFSSDLMTEQAQLESESKRAAEVSNKHSLILDIDIIIEQSLRF